MLIITRKPKLRKDGAQNVHDNESKVTIQCDGKVIEVQIVQMSSGQVKIGFNGPSDFNIIRNELLFKS